VGRIVRKEAPVALAGRAERGVGRIGRKEAVTLARCGFEREEALKTGAEGVHASIS
jgi:hypothetical protein